MESWTRYTTAGLEGSRRPTDQVQLGPGDSAGLDRKLLGDVQGTRILELGTGAGNSAVALAHLGARVTAIGTEELDLARARKLAEEHEVHVELHHGDLADLAFLQPDSFDAVIAVHSLAAVEDLGRVFRQTHRILKSDRPIVLTLPHPAVFDDRSGPPLGADNSLTHRHTISDVFTQLTRANYRVDTLLEPAEEGATTPISVVLRARKIGN